MNIRSISFIRNFSYSIMSNFISLLVSTLVILIIPKLIGVEEYGYWQLYLFYGSYVGLMHFGWIDGIYLRYGGKKYKELDKKLFFSQFYMLLGFQAIIAIFIIVIGTCIPFNVNRAFILRMIVINMLIMNIFTMLQLILQATNRIREYALVEMTGRICYFLLIITILALGIRDYKVIIIADIIGKLTSLSISIYIFKDIILQKATSFYFSFNEALVNVSVGIKLMFANIAGMLIVGIIRYGIESSWDVETFGKVSLTLSASNLMMLFINAVGIIMFPILRNTNEKTLPIIYSVMRDFLMVLLFGLLIIYYPLQTVLSAWLPKYADSLLYMALVFPVFIFEGKMALLINTYLKTLRKEKLMLIINLISLSLSSIITYITTQIFENLIMSILSIIIMLAFRSILAEIYLSKVLKISMYKDILLELILTIVFVMSSWLINSWYTVLVYGLVYLFYLLIKRNDITSTVKYIKSFMTP